VLQVAHAWDQGEGASQYLAGADEADLGVLGLGEVFDGDGACCPGPHVREEAVFLHHGQDLAGDGVEYQEDPAAHPAHEYSTGCQPPPASLGGGEGGAHGRPLSTFLTKDTVASFTVNVASPAI